MLYLYKKLKFNFKFKLIHFFFKIILMKEKIFTYFKTNFSDTESNE